MLERIAGNIPAPGDQRIEEGLDAVRINALRTTIGDLSAHAEYVENSSDFFAIQKVAHAEGPEPPGPKEACKTH